MENIDEMEVGLPVYDLNRENLNRTDWAATPLGPRQSWPLALKVLVSTCVLPVPHCAAIFWGEDFHIVHNLAWGKGTASFDMQGSPADTHGELSGEALRSLRAAARGRTVKVDCEHFMKHIDVDAPETTILLSPLVDEVGTRQGVYAQLLHQPTVEMFMGISGHDRLMYTAPGRELQEKAARVPKVAERSPPRQGGKIPMNHKQTQLFQRFAELLPNGLAILDSAAEAIFVNDNFFKLTSNDSPKEFQAWPDSIDPRDYDRVMSQYQKAFSSREELRVEFRTIGSRNPEQWRLFLLRPLGEPIETGFICAVVDITEIKNAQLTQEKAAIEARDRKEQQERFIDMVSHEIRNPLSAVMHLSQEIKEIAQQINEKHTTALEEITSILDAADTILLCVSHQNTLVDDILSFSKLDSMMLSLVPRVVRPKWEFAQSLKVFQSEFKAKHIQFEYVMDISFDEQKIEFVIADLNRMKQVLVNLITNAIKFTAKKQGKRHITVSMGASVQRPTSYPPNVIYFSLDKEAFHIDSTMSAEWGQAPSIYLMVAVRDTGIGIGSEDQRKLFARFGQATPKTQEKYGGSGLGPFISRKLCQLHGGDIGVSSKEGEGSTFGFFFKVRRSDGSGEGGKPPLPSRSSSESNAMSQRPGFGRTKSSLHRIEDESRASPSVESRSQPQGNFSANPIPKHQEQSKPNASPSPVPLDIDVGKMERSLENPQTELTIDAHPGPNESSRLRETKDIAINVKSNLQESAKSGRTLESGETKQQSDTAKEISNSQRNEASGVHQTILLVEDNLINQKVLRRQLQSRGFEVFVANNGQEAVDAVVKRVQEGDSNSNVRNYFDCILMDQEMPIMDGNTATEEIRVLQNEGKAGKSPILGVSANVREAQKESMLDAGMDAIICKPFKVEDLVSKIKSLTSKE
ncbi:two component histidine kinase 1 [Amniculicola lignicola CBS 123094]|uniref:Two component histidine kinase 1 n=1 Tax=Amniculicola lignicola CBS 123094 TaxID=1392246 RepID=A0A6A5WRJ3_9PLEO|nr:two component histidine kinase 1 [Amniculicola lignicola CBS 123094]